MAVKKILVVDDEPKIVEMVRVILESEGFKVIEALSGAECLRIIKRSSPDAILLDIMMPDMDGWVVYRKIKENDKTASIPVIMLTARAGTIDREMGLDVIGVDDYITKPFLPDELVEKINTILKPKS